MGFYLASTPERQKNSKKLRNYYERASWYTEIAGCVTIKAARENGLEAGTPVVTGTDDAMRLRGCFSTAAAKKRFTTNRSK